MVNQAQIVKNIQTDTANNMTTNFEHEEELITNRKYSQRSSGQDGDNQQENEEEDMENPNNQALISMGKERLSSEPIEILVIDDATNFH